MGGKYEVKARNYNSICWEMILFCDKKRKALRMWKRLSSKFDYVELIKRSDLRGGGQGVEK